jgi:hypothetical protein
MFTNSQKHGIVAMSKEVMSIPRIISKGELTMWFRNPEQTMIIEGRLPRKDEHFSEDRFYTDIQNVFVRFDPYEDYIRVTFPGISSIELKLTYNAMNELAKRDASILDLIISAYNVDSISKTPKIGYHLFSELYVLFIRFNDP